MKFENRATKTTLLVKIAITEKPLARNITGSTPDESGEANNLAKAQ